MKTWQVRTAAAMTVMLLMVQSTVPAFSYEDEPQKPSSQASKFVIADLNDFTSVMAYAQVINSINDNIPKEIVDEFIKHGGFVNIESYEGNNSGVTYLALDDNGHPDFPDVYYINCPTRMYISPNDSIYYYPKEYVVHEFGHVFDAMYHITADPDNYAKIQAEAPAIDAILAPYYVTPGHFSAPEEALAQVFASIYAPKDVRCAEQVIAAAPETVSIIRRYSAESEE